MVCRGISCFAFIRNFSEKYVSDKPVEILAATRVDSCKSFFHHAIFKNIPDVFFNGRKTSLIQYGKIGDTQMG